MPSIEKIKNLIRHFKLYWRYLLIVLCFVIFPFTVKASDDCFTDSYGNHFARVLVNNDYTSDCANNIYRNANSHTCQLACQHCYAEDCLSVGSNTSGNNYLYDDGVTYCGGYISCDYGQTCESVINANYNEGEGNCPNYTHGLGCKCGNITILDNAIIITNLLNGETINNYNFSPVVTGVYGTSATGTIDTVLTVTNNELNYIKFIKGNLIGNGDFSASLVGVPVGNYDINASLIQSNSCYNAQGQWIYPNCSPDYLATSTSYNITIINSATSSQQVYNDLIKEIELNQGRIISTSTVETEVCTAEEWASGNC